MRQQLLVIILCLGAVSARAQISSKISGSINDGQEKGLAAVTVSLISAEDSSLVKLAVTDKNGQYEFINIKPGQYRVSASLVGYEKNISPAFTLNGSDIKVPTIDITPVSKNMTGVVIETKKPFVETKLDKTIVNVDASPTSAGASALEILEKSPGIMVNNDGIISLKGKQGVIVMMDGKQTYLSPTDLASMLKNMPASALDQIEIMTNPSSKYDASGNSGVINIKTKKGKSKGLNGSVMVGATASFYEIDDNLYVLPKSQNSFNFNYRKNKINLFGNYNPNYFRGRGSLEFDGKFLDSNKQITGYNTNVSRFKFGNTNHTLKLGLDWYADKKNVFGIVVSGFSFFGHPTPQTVGELFDENYQLESRLVSNTKNDIRFRNLSTNLNWKHSFDSAGKELTADFDWVKYGNVSDLVLTTDYYDGSQQFLSRTFLKGHLPANIDIYTFKTDYTHPLKNGRFEFGYKYSNVTNDNEVDYERSFGGKYVRDTVRSNHFIYKEVINAAYVNINKQISKWTLQAGLRLENTTADGNQVISKTTFKRDTLNLFPTAFVSYELNKKNTLTASYGRRIQRPNYRDMNPFIFFLDTLSYRQGNIYLRPQYTHNVELTHSFLGKFITTLNYNIQDDVISQIIKPVSDTSKIRFLTVDNVATAVNIGISVTAPIQFAKWWNANLFTNVFNNHYEGVLDNIVVDMEYTSFMVNMTNNFTIKKGLTAELSGFYRHKGIDQLTLMEPIYQMSLGFQKQVMKGKGTVRLNIRDPFAWQRFRGSNVYGLIDGNFEFKPDSRQVTATFTWRFGGNGQNSQPRRRTSSSQEEQGRVGGAGQQ